MNSGTQTKIIPSLGVALVLGLFASAVSAQTNLNPAPFALDALVSEVLEKNPELKFYEAEIAAAKGEQRTAKALANP
ncbi:MAG: transporter, partial [Limisphaerales bacterium]